MISDEIRARADGNTDRQGRRTFTVRELQAMPEAMQRAIRSIKVRTVKDTVAGTEQVVDVKLWGKARALMLAARAGMRP